MATRFAVVDDERDLILGKDNDGVFEKGVVYGAIKVMDEIILKPLGKYALEECGQPCLGSDVNDMVGYARHLYTKEEWEEKCSAQSVESKSRHRSLR